jgi:hypothetical protein
MNWLKTIFRTWWLTLLGVALGALGGYLYWHEIGCASGHCLITSRPLNSTLYGAMMGGLLVNTFSTKKSEKQA